MPSLPVERRYILRGRDAAPGGGVEALARRLADFHVRLDRTFGVVVVDLDGRTFVARATAAPEDMARSAEVLGLDFFPDLSVSK